MRTSSGVGSKYLSVILERYTPDVFEFKLNRPKNMNSINFQMAKIMMDKIKMWHEKKEDTPKVLLLSGVGKVFSAGGDIVNSYKFGLTGNLKTWLENP